MSLPTGMTKFLKDRGFSAKRPMESIVNEWNGWYKADNGWYNYSEIIDGQTFKVNRISVKPARMTAQEWSGLLITENMLIACPESEPVTKVIDTYTDNGSFARDAQENIEWSFALGTGAFVERFENVEVDSETAPDAEIFVDTYDALNIIPLTYSAQGCTEAAFTSERVLMGKTYDQIVLHRLDEDDEYVIETGVFKNGALQNLDDFNLAEQINTRSKEPTFVLTRPAIANTYQKYSPMGVSVFDDALGAVQLVDEGVDNMHKDIFLGQMMVFIDEDLIGLDEHGKAIVPREADQQLFRKMEGGSQIAHWAPNLRVEQNRNAITSALELLGLRTGFGADYFALSTTSRGVGIKTATEVISENSDLYRSIRRHENNLTPAFQQLFTSIADHHRTVLGRTDIPEEIPPITIEYDDSIIEDSSTIRKRDKEDVSMGAMGLAEYRAEWYGESEDEAERKIKEIAEENSQLMFGNIPEID